GNSAINVLDGGPGADTMTGGAGNDTYVVDNAFDVVTENVNAGNDTGYASINYTLRANVENLFLTGAPINGSGNSLDNLLPGNSGDNTLDGGPGVDILLGGIGNDTYVLDTAFDQVIENANEGIDTIYIGAGYTLGANVENLVLVGTTAINGAGNSLNNTISG